MESDNSQKPAVTTTRPDIKSIYPDPEPTSAPQPINNNTNEPKLTNSFVKQFVKAISTFLLGLLIIGVIGFLIGLITKGPVVRATGYYGGVANFFTIILYLIPLTIFFSFVAYVKKDLLFAFYPVIVFFIGVYFINKELINLLGNYVPYGTQHESFNKVELAIASACVFMAVYAFERPLTHIIRSFKLPPVNARRQQIIYGIILALVIVSAFVIPKLAHTLYMAQLRSRAAIHLPENDQIIGRVVTDAYLDSAQLGDVSIVYTEPTEQYDGTYQKTDILKIEPLQKWWVRSAQANCGTGKTLSTFPGQTATFEYKTTSNNYAYAETSFSGNLSNPPKASTAFNEFHFCFVRGYQKYTLVRTNKDSSAYLEKYTASEVIDAVAQGARYFPVCRNMTKDKQSAAFKATVYCNQSDLESLNTINEKASIRLTTSRPTKKSTGIISPTINKSAYKEQARLTITEWGISLPLNEDILDAYYVPSSESNADIFTLSLRSYNTSACLAGLGTDVSGNKIRGVGIAFISRRKVADLNESNGTSFTGTTVGDYVYGLYANGNLQKCLDSVQKDAAFKTKLSDIFEWSEAGIR